MSRDLVSKALAMASMLGSGAPDLPAPEGGGVRSFDKKGNVKWNRQPMARLSFGRRIQGLPCPKNAEHGQTRKRYCPTCKARVQPPKR